jgi:AmmeMemoRadiSam system protein B
MLPTHPRLRALEAFPIDEEDGGQRRLCLRDPSGLTEHVAMLPAAAVIVVALCDGTRDLAAIQSEIQKRYRERVPLSAIQNLLEQLDEGLLLDSPRFAEHRAKLHADFHAAPRRAAVHAGASYPSDPGSLRQFLDGFFRHERGPGALPNAQRPAPLPSALIAPHIDFHRGGPTYAHTYLPLHEASVAPELVVVFGTDHNGVDQPFTLTRKTYETPFGALETDVDLVERLRERAGGEALFADEFHHRGEHSIEFQAVALRHAWPSADLRVLPILVGSFHRFVADGDHADPAADPNIGRFLDELATAAAGRRTLFIAGADLAHVGPRFGDPRPLTNKDRAALADADQGSLDRCAAGDALGFFRQVARDGDARRICGLSPIYSMLRVTGGGRGRAIGYDQCPADDQGGSLVSIAGVVFD